MNTQTECFHPLPACRPDILLTSGRLIHHTRMDNGAQAADVAGGGEMTHAEWDEYVQIVLRQMRQEVRL